MRVAQLFALVVILLPASLAGQEKPPFPVDVGNPDAVLKAIGEKYPPLLRDAGIQDSVLVEFVVAPNGEVQETRIVRASDHNALNNAALFVARMVVFNPRQDQSVRRICIELRFRDSRSRAETRKLMARSGPALRDLTVQRSVD